MSEEFEWFAPKRYGYGAGLPISWQGWALTLGFVALAFGVSIEFRDEPLVAAAIMIPAVAAFLVITAKTTRGGWRWRWGNED